MRFIGRYTCYYHPPAGKPRLHGSKPGGQFRRFIRQSSVIASSSVDFGLLHRWNHRRILAFRLRTFPVLRQVGYLSLVTQDAADLPRSALESLFCSTVELVQVHAVSGMRSRWNKTARRRLPNPWTNIGTFGASLALGILSGAAQSSVGNVGINETGSEAYRAGVASSVSQSSTRILDRFLNINPTLTVREGHSVKVYLTNDLLLPAYENHTVPPNI